MKTLGFFTRRLVSLCGAVALACPGIVVAQTTSIPVVTICATDSLASWTGDAGTFTLFRAGPTNQSLVVYCNIAGTASNGQDYASISAFVNIPAGVISNTVTISPINKGQTDTETVVLTLGPSPLMMPVNYTIGQPDTATVYITPPGVTNVPNIPPAVRMISPANGSVFRAPINLPLYAFAADPDGSVNTVQFFENGTNIGFGRQIPPPVVNPATGSPPIFATNIYFLVWSNVPPGAYGLTAVATDNGGASTTSDPVKIAVLPGPPPPTNEPPIVSIVAIDPIAIEGTNCWPWVGLAAAVPTWSNWAAALPCRYFTNCGPKTAVFAVRRFGVTNNDLAVNYAIGGTATNGVDYLSLPGTVTIPAGERSALVTVVPIDDGPPDISSTVVLKLAPSTNTPPDYFVGVPKAAAALILDGPPRPVTAAVLPDKCFRLHANGPDAAWFRIDYSVDFQRWTPLCTNQVVQGSIDFIDPDAPNDQSRMYRAVPEFAAPLY